MIVLAPQLEDWGELSTNKTIALTKYFSKHYATNSKQGYISGYSGGGETLSLVLTKSPELYCRALMCSSKWDGYLIDKNDCNRFKTMLLYLGSF